MNLEHLITWFVQQELVRHKGILSTPDLFHGHPLSSETSDLVRVFYENDDASHMMKVRKILFQ